MVYYAGNMILNEVRAIYSGKKNDVLICQDINSPFPLYYTLLVIKDRDCAKVMLGIYENSEKTYSVDETPYIKCFAQNENLCFLYNYRVERNMEYFLDGQMQTSFDREQAAISLTMEALSTGYPYPLLHLILNQHQVHINKDNIIFFTPYFDLENLDETKSEADCTESCAYIILDILQSEKKKKLKSFKLIQKKVERNTYHSLHELYRDIRLTALPQKKKSLWKKIKMWFRENKDNLFRILLIFCVIVALITILIVISQIFFGDIPLFKIFEHSFDIIGTETLK